MDEQPLAKQPLGPNAPQPTQPTDQQPLRESQPVHTTADYANFRPPKHHHVGRMILVIVLILVLLGGGGAAYWLFFRKSPATTQQTTSKQSTTSNTGSGVSPATTSTKSYTSQNFNLSFTYPDTWTVADNGGGKLTVTSPSTQLKSANGKTTTGTIVMTIQNKQTTLPAFKSGDAVAILASQKVAYSKPTSSQRAQTYLSFLQYAGSSAGIDGVYITGDNGYQKAQNIPQTDVIKVDPLVTVTFTDSNGAALTLAVSSWNDTAFSGPITDMLKSLAFN